jgi:hypothetical protein
MSSPFIVCARALLLLIPVALVLGALACAKTKKEEHKSGRLNFVEDLKYGPAGVHGQPGWYRTGQNIYVNGRRWSPPNIKMDDISRCEESPNLNVEALNCHSFEDMKESAFVLHMKDEKPEWVTASSEEYHGGNNLGEWVGDGYWLLFHEYYFDVLTGERKPIKGLPDDPGKYYRAASPDMKTVVYEEYCFIGRPDLANNSEKEKITHEQCKRSAERATKGLLGFWLIDTETGAVKILNLKREKYPAIDRNKSGEAHFSARFQQLLTWKKDENGRDQLVAPTGD